MKLNIKDYFLRAETKEQIDVALEGAGILTITESEAENGEVEREYTYSAAVDYVGTVHRPTGAMITDDDGVEYPETAPVDGYHANVRGNLTPEQVALLPCIERPGSPQRIFAGDVL